ncbi:MAG: hypothetical protein AAF998_11295 [Bacteroidota bacterium]
MRKILCIQLGRTGLFLGDSFWTALRDDNRILPSGKYRGPHRSRSKGYKNQEAYRIAFGEYMDKAASRLLEVGTFFDQTSSSLFTPRSLLIDTDPTRLENAAHFVAPPHIDNWIIGNEDADANWAKGYHVRGPELIDQIVTAVEAQTIAHDLDGIILFHSLGGGTGSGLGTLLLERLRASRSYFGTLATVSVLPSPRMQENVLEPYNAVLGLSKIAKLADLCFLVENEALRNIAMVHLRQKDPTYADLNLVAGRALAGLARLISSLGLPRLRGYLRPERWMNLITVSTAQFQPHDTSLLPRDLLQQVLAVYNGLVAFRPEDGKALIRYLLFRGSIDRNATIKEIRHLRNQLPPPFPDWPTNSMVPHFQDWGLAHFKNNLTMVSNHTGIKMALVRLLKDFNQLYGKRKFVSAYTSHGMPESEFMEAARALQDLIQAYQAFENQQVDRDEDEEE